VWTADGDEGGFAQSNFMRRLSKSKQSQGGFVRSLSRGSLNGGEMNDTTRSDSFAMNHSTAWFEDDPEPVKTRFARRNSPF
jgi:hypothetical protein